MDYTNIRNKVCDLINHRAGMSNPVIIAEITGLICNRAYTNGFTEEDVVEFLDVAKEHEIKRVYAEPRWYGIEELVSEELRANPLFYALEADLMDYRPGKSQTGPGEFFFCFFDKHSEFSVSATCGYDVVSMGVKCEFKKIGTNFTSDSKFDEYAQKGVVDTLVVVKPVNGNSKKPRNRTQVIFAPINEWRKYVKHNEGGSGGLKENFFVKN